MRWTKVYFSTIKMQIFNMSIYAQFDELLFEIILFKGFMYLLHLFKGYFLAFMPN
jgi:hypothetical protein